MPKLDCDVLILGSGAAGLTLALNLPGDCRIMLLAKNALDDGSTQWAQGGIAAVLDPRDSVEEHVRDTLIAGAQLPDPPVAHRVALEAPEAIRWLRAQGMPFSSDARGELHLTREGGHGHRRVAHAADHTGAALETTLLANARARPNIRLMPRHIGIDLITSRRLGLCGDAPRPGQARDRCLGAYVLDRDAGEVHAIRARFVVLASGGASKVYLYTSNPDGSTGDGIAMAWRAGCRVANMEFIQFHPTCLYEPRAKSFLISEAVRGEGGRLLLPDGSRFMHRFDPRGELAPRDVVARAIDHEMKRLGLDCVYLDISHKSRDFIREHFPTIHARCLEFGYDITRQPIPVVPAAHYTCGGVIVDSEGRTDLDALYAVGEVSHTGLHGANRLASNSLLECLVYGRAAALDIARRLEEKVPRGDIPDWDESQVTNSDEEVVVSHNWHELRQAMWDYVGIVRTTKRLQRARHRIALLRREIHEYYSHFRVTNNLIELRNLVEVADLIVRSALRRKESRGLHYTSDFPEADDQRPPRNTVLIPRPPQPYSGLPPSLDDD
ncbi:MAG: L-aspartate oxidase [Halothiobacillaceae bacterium]|nr:L-aspartate oxidase [Halothiobacillaceae bacterium]MDD3609924.1 L-aspartate oxidase [Halothiobacillaceae bacterium]